MVDTSAVVYGTSDECMPSVLINQTCIDIFKDAHQIFFDPAISQKENAFFALLEKYNKHYLVYYFMGIFYNKLRNLNASLACYKICISIYPLVDAYLNICIIFQQAGQLEMTKKILALALQHSSDIRLLNFVGTLYYLEKDYFKAVEYFGNIIKNHPQHSMSLKNIYNNFGFSCTAIGKCKKAMSMFEDGMRINCEDTPENVKMNVQLLQNKLINYDYMYDIPPNIFDDFLRINKFYKTVNKCSRSKSTSGRIRIGYISPDLRHHVCAYFLEPILQYYDRSKFIVYCFANVKREDGVSMKFKNFPEMNWFNVHGMETEDVCNLIHSHKIDILIDLAGQTNENRLDVMSKKPAPIQMTYLGYPNTTGLTSVDYRITDRIADPPDTKQMFSEKLIYMPRTFICYTVSIKLEDIPIRYNKRNFITFGVMNKLNKHNKVAVEVWSEILKRVPNSIFLVKRDMKSSFENRIKHLTKRGISEDRIKVSDFLSELDYCELYNSVDMCLDTFPYSGTTTSCDGLKMGTPIVTLNIPNRHVSNVTSSLLTNIGCPELIAHSLDEYVNIAVALANDTDRIARYKNTIRPKFLELMDGKRFSSEFDALMMNTFAKHK